MIDSSFLFQMILSFVVGSFWVLLTTFFADRVGSKLGGFIGGLPSTAAVSFFFIGLMQSPQTAAQATTVFPLSYIQYSALQYLYRAVFGGFIVSLAVFLSRIAGPVFGGIFSAFPAVFISILIINYRSRGMEFSRAMTKPLLVSGMISIFMYGLGVRYLYPSLGLWWGTLGAYIFAMSSSFLSYFLIHKKFI